MELLAILGLIFIYMNTLFVISLIIKNNGLADIGWGFGFIVISFYYLITFGFSLPLILVIIWGLRLTFHIGLRNLKKPEDFRYAAWRREWGKTFVFRSWLQVYMLQGLMMFLIALPLFFNTFSGNLNYLILFLGLLIWLIGFLFEAIADYQLKLFKQKKQKGILKTGLWKYSRHPNYFGESLIWIGIFITSLGYFNSLKLFGIISPILITYLLAYVSGVPMLEKKYQGNPEYEAYKLESNCFIPWFNKERR